MNSEIKEEKEKSTQKIEIELDSSTFEELKAFSKMLYRAPEELVRDTLKHELKYFRQCLNEGDFRELFKDYFHPEKIAEKISELEKGIINS